MEDKRRYPSHEQVYLTSLPKRRSSGFTLIELVITIAVAAILLGVAVPSFQQAMRANRIASIANDLVASLQLARSEAVTRGRRVTLCTSANVDAVPPTCSASASWQDGWVVFVDDGVEGALDGTDTALKVGQPSSGAAVISGGTNFASYISYLPTGASDGASAPDGGFTICIPPDQRTISLNRTGRVSVTKGSCS